MKDIIICYLPSQKTFANNLCKTLLDNGYQVSLEYKDLIDAKSFPYLVLLALTNDAIKDDNLIKILDNLDKNGVPVIPLCQEEISKDIFSDYFLNGHTWVDFSNPKEGNLDILDLLNKNFSDLKLSKEPKQKDRKKIVRNQKKQSQTSNNQKYKIPFFVSLIVCVFCFIALINQSNENQNIKNSIPGANNPNLTKLSVDLKKSESPLVGTWVLSDYFDNNYRATLQDTIDYQNLVKAIIGNARLKFNDDKTFTRDGFSQYQEKGSWQYDPSNKYLKLQSISNEHIDIVQVQSLDDNLLIIVVNEKAGSNDIITKLTFKKSN